MQATCHPDRPLFSREMCKACYNREYRAKLRENSREISAKREHDCLCQHPDELAEFVRNCVRSMGIVAEVPTGDGSFARSLYKGTNLEVPIVSYGKFEGKTPETLVGK